MGWKPANTSLHVLKRRCVIGLMEEERVFISTHKNAVSLPTCPLAQPTSWVPPSLLHQSSLLTQATAPTHSGVAHCGLYKLVSLATASHCSPRRSSILAGHQLLLRQSARPAHCKLEATTAAASWAGDRLSESLRVQHEPDSTRNDIKAQTKYLTAYIKLHIVWLDGRVNPANINKCSDREARGKVQSLDHVLIIVDFRKYVM